MIITGLQEPDGTITPVQGAGTVYDEQKNSLALGKDTIASGQDQFVFGRANVEDTQNKYVEVAGSGFYERTFVEGDSFIIGDVLGGADKGRSRVWRLRKIFNSYAAAKEYILGLGIGAEDLILQASPLSYEDIKFFAFEHLEYGEGYIYPILTAAFSNKSAEELSYGDTFYMSGVSTDIPIAYDAVAVKFTNFYNITESLQRANIRTLDWEGNQWNAGDVTCDDEEHENVLSLRETAAKADELETSKADAVHTHDGIAASSGSGVTMKGAIVFAEVDGNNNPRVRIRIAPSRDLHYDANIDASSIANLKRALAEPDATPTEDSDNLMTSGAIYTALAALEARIAALETE